MRKTQAQMEEVIRDLAKWLDHAITCIEYCRNNHTDTQTGTGGVRVEVFYRGSIDRAEFLVGPILSKRKDI